MEGKSWPIGQVIRSFAGLCDEAKNAGTHVVLEILPWSNIPDIKTGVEVVSGADKSNGGLLIDIWHMGRGGIPYSELASMPRRFLGHVELSDAASEPIGKLIEDTGINLVGCAVREASMFPPSFDQSKQRATTGHSASKSFPMSSETGR